MKGDLNSYGHRTFERGELVRLRSTPSVTGQVIGEQNWGKTYLVRLSDSFEPISFEDVELESFGVVAVANAGHDEEPEKGNSNVINLAQVRTAGRA